MNALECTISQYRSLRLSATAAQLAELLAEAEANELSYLSFAQRLAEHELTQRTRTRIERHLRQANLPALELVEDLDLAEMKGELKKRVTQLSKFDPLIIDELGYLPMTRQARYNLFQLINSLYEYRSIILTTNKDFTSWGEFFHDDNVAVPIIDRIIHHSHIFMLGGESYRLKQKTTV